MSWESEQFSNGMIISYNYPDKDNPQYTSGSQIKLHFEYKGRYSHQTNFNPGDLIDVVRGFRESLDDLKKWINKHGMPESFSGKTKTHFLLRMLRSCGFSVTKGDSSDEYNFTLVTEGRTDNEIFQQIDQGLENILKLASATIARRKRIG